MRIKEHLDKIRLSHLLCLFFGALIPIYADVLFLHGFNSSTVSAIMDTVLATAAIYAAFGVRHWLRDRVKNKGFEHAQSILIDIQAINRNIFDLHTNFVLFASHYMNGGELGKEGINTLKFERDALIAQCSKTREKSLEILIAILGLSSWDMKCNYEEEYISFLKTIENSRQTIEVALLLLDQDSHIVRLKQWEESKEEITKIKKDCSTAYNELDKRFVSAFSYAPPSE
ncbi:hypothetical protein [Enterobacter asburiae]|uniref:hypothetical protein n=1 Tax=Enterobacter asburiae TaxID=61645 RepID=UPI0020062AD9|nr:hypothetical protein [Enterobacter asburiae]MCK7245058.1 hypothetical protein [Enterobacter asburiae]